MITDTMSKVEVLTLLYREFNSDIYPRVERQPPKYKALLQQKARREKHTVSTGWQELQSSKWLTFFYKVYTSGSQTDPQGPSSGSYRVVRGGGWYNGARYCRVSFRTFIIPSYRVNFLGFRVVMLP